MAGEDDDRRVRLTAFAWLERQVAIHGDVLPRSLLQQGFQYQGRRVPLVGPQGIFKPAVIPTGIPLSITTVPEVEGKDRPYEDEVGPDGLRYRYRGTDTAHHENVGLRRAMAEQAPLVYCRGVVPGQYLVQWPVYIVGDDPARLTFTVEADDPAVLSGAAGLVADDPARRSYVTRLARQRLHQALFRQRVLAAYHQSCAVCRLRHTELLDAAHILSDTHPRGEPVVPNGLAMCKIHHSAFDANILGVRPDLVVEIRDDILRETDGPMLRYGLQESHGGLLFVPRRPTLKPDPERLAERYEEFRQAS